MFGGPFDGLSTANLPVMGPNTTELILSPSLAGQTSRGTTGDGLTDISDDIRARRGDRQIAVVLQIGYRFVDPLPRRRSFMSGVGVMRVSRHGFILALRAVAHTTNRRMLRSVLPLPTCNLRRVAPPFTRRLCSADVAIESPDDPHAIPKAAQGSRSSCVLALV